MRGILSSYSPVHGLSPNVKRPLLAIYTHLDVKSPLWGVLMWCTQTPSLLVLHNLMRQSKYFWLILLSSETEKNASSKNIIGIFF